MNVKPKYTDNFIASCKFSISQGRNYKEEGDKLEKDMNEKVAEIEKEIATITKMSLEEWYKSITDARIQQSMINSSSVHCKVFDESYTSGNSTNVGDDNVSDEDNDNGINKDDNITQLDDNFKLEEEDNADEVKEAEMKSDFYFVSDVEDKVEQEKKRNWLLSTIDKGKNIELPDKDQQIFAIQKMIRKNEGKKTTRKRIKKK